MSTKNPIVPGDLAAALAVTPGAADLGARRTGDTLGSTGDRSAGRQVLAELVEPLGDLQRTARQQSATQETATQETATQQTARQQTARQQTAARETAAQGTAAQGTAPPGPGAEHLVEDRRPRLMAEQV